MTSNSKDDIRSNNDDLRLAKSIADGSTVAWHEFLERYAGLIYHVILRHLPADDEDDVRSLYVDVLKALYSIDLGKYSGYVDMQSWLMLVTRRRSLDYLRSRYGRRREPKAFGRLNKLDRDVFRLFYAERLPIEVVIQMLDWNGHSITVDGLVDSIQRIEDVLGRTFLARLEERYVAKRNGVGNISALRYIVTSRVEYEGRTKNNTSDRFVIEQESARQAERVKELLSQFSREEQRVVQLRFQEGLSAEDISQRLNFDGRRRVYTVIERVLRRLRTIMNDA